jgi:hypothetical protein
MNRMSEPYLYSWMRGLRPGVGRALCKGILRQEIFMRVTSLVPRPGDAQPGAGYGTIRMLWWFPVRGFVLRLFRFAQ